MPQENKTPEKILENILTFRNEDILLGRHFHIINQATQAMQEYGRQEFNRAIELAAEKAEVMWVKGTQRDFQD